MLKLTEIVFYDREHGKWDFLGGHKQAGRNKDNPFKWYEGKRADDDDEDFDDRKEWYIYLSVKTIAQCLGVSTKVDALMHLYDRIAAASRVLQNIDIEISTRQNGEVVKTRIDGYLDFVGVRDCSYTEERYLTKSNALFAFKLNDKLIDFIAKQNLGFYPFNHGWLGLPEHSQNAYAAAKRLARHYNQNTFGRKISISDPAAIMKIGTLRYCLPKLNSKHDGENRVALDNALKSIPCTRYAYIKGKQQLTFEELTELRLHRAKYDEVKVGMVFYDHPNTSPKKVTTERIEGMNEDRCYIYYPVYSLDIADKFIDHKGLVKRPAKKHNPNPAVEDDTIGGEGEITEHDEEPSQE
jgi:hypothetical protein